MFLALVILIGLVIGSFLNVCIVRVPLQESLVKPRSHCRSCETPIVWYDNIPVLSYLLLRGRCRSCKAYISPRYVVVEVLTAVLFVLLFERGFEPRALAVHLALVSSLVVVSFIDIDHLIIPDAITLPSILVAPALAIFVQHISLASSAIGIAVGGGSLWLIGWLYERARKREGMGFGDVKLLAMIGGLQGFPAVLFTLVVGPLIGMVFTIGLVATRRGKLETPIPFGPFLAAGSVIYALAGKEIISWYFSAGRLL